MIVADEIYDNVRKLPEPLQAEVLDFVAFLLLKTERETAPEDENAWARFSLDMAMRGLESEESANYTLSDVREKF